MSKVTQDFSLLRDLPEGIADEVKFFHYGRHYIFLKQAASHLQEKLQVLTILHDNMDVPIRLREILERL